MNTFYIYFIPLLLQMFQHLHSVLLIYGDYTTAFKYTLTICF